MSDVNSIAPPELGERGEEMVSWEMARDPNLSRDAAIGNVMQYVVGNAQGVHGQVPEGFHEAFPLAAPEAVPETSEAAPEPVAAESTEASPEPEEQKITEGEQAAE